MQGEAKEFYSDGVVLKDGRQVEADVVVLATGYHRAFGFLGKEIKRIVKYDDTKPGLSMSLFRGIFHPELKGMCFVGNVRAFIPARYELQAEIGIRYMLGTLNLGDEEILQGVNDEDNMRNEGNDIDYDPKSYLYELLKLLKLNVGLEFIREKLDFENGIFLPQFLGVTEPEQLVLCREVVQEIKSRHPEYLCA